MKEKSDFETVFAALKPVLQAYASHLVVKADEPGNYYLETLPRRNGKALFFGAVQIKKNYVSYHLMAVYIFPDLLNTISPALRKRMQGKSCFNFTKVDTALIEELVTLTRSSFEYCQGENFI
jgi:hypothetical protein